MAGPGVPAMSALCRACQKPIGVGNQGTLYHYKVCFAVKPREDGRGCVICNRVRVGPKYCMARVCAAYRARRAVERTRAIQAGAIRVSSRCSCGQLVEHDLTVGRPKTYCSEECRRKEFSVRDKEARAAHWAVHPRRDYTKCPNCLTNDRPPTGDGKRLRGWCKPCENKAKRERPNPAARAVTVGLRTGKVLQISDADLASI